MRNKGLTPINTRHRLGPSGPLTRVRTPAVQAAVLQHRNVGAGVAEQDRGIVRSLMKPR